MLPTASRALCGPEWQRLTTERHLRQANEVDAPELTGPLGNLYLYRDAQQLAKSRAAWDLRRRHGTRVEVLDRAGNKTLQPPVGPAYRIGVFLPEHAHCVSPHRYARAVAEAFRRAGGKIRRDRICALRLHDGRIAGAVGEALDHAA